MAVRDVAGIKTIASSRFADNATGQISAGDSSDTFSDVADSFLNITDHLLDEDDMASNSDTAVPTQQSVKAYSDTKLGSIGIIDSVTAGENGAVISSGALILQSASSTVPGLVSTGAQTFVGAKVFSSAVDANLLTSITTAGPLSSYTTDNKAGFNGYTLNTGSLEGVLDIYATRSGNGSSLGGSIIRFLTHSTSATVGATERMRIDRSGNVGIGTTTPNAVLHLKAGTATANTAPLKLTTGTALTTPEDGAIEYHSSHLYFTIGSTRYQLDQQATNVISGTFSPTFTSETNLDSTPVSTALTSKYTRVGDMVTVTMYANVDPTASGAYSFFATLPVASNLAAATDLLGIGSSGTADGHRCEVVADITNDRAHIKGTSSGTATGSLYLTYTYKVI